MHIMLIIIASKASKSMYDFALNLVLTYLSLQFFSALHVSLSDMFANIPIPFKKITVF